MKVLRSASLVLTALLLVLVPGLAHADVRKHSDVAKDVQYWINTDPSHIPPPIAVPKRTNGDLTAIKITHGTSTVRVVASFRTLTRAGQFHGHVFRFVAGTFERKVQLTAGPGEVRGWTGTTLMSTPSGKTVTCRGMKHHLDYAEDRLVLDVPRSCLRNPASVKVGVGTVMLVGSRTYFDDGFRTRGTMGMTALRPTLGPAVAR